MRAGFSILTNLNSINFNTNKMIFKSTNAVSGFSAFGRFSQWNKPIFAARQHEWIMKILFSFLLICFCASAQNVTNLYVGQLLYSGEQLSTIPSSNTPFSFTNIVLSDNPNMAFFFNDASGHITDYAGTNTTASVPSGITLGIQGAIAGSTMTCASNIGTAQMSLVNNLFNSFTTNSSYTYTNV